MSQKKTEKSGQKKRGFSALFGKSSLEFGRLYPNIDETTTKNSTKERVAMLWQTWGQKKRQKNGVILKIL